LINVRGNEEERDVTSNEGQSFVATFYASKKSTTQNKIGMNSKKK
jgi:hypothetical protein